MTEMRTPYAYERTTAAAPATERERPIEIALQELGKGIEENAELVARLADHLQTVTSAPRPEATGGGQVPENDAAGAPLRKRLAARNVQLAETNHRLSDILQRLEL